ncbi:transcriptional regulator family: Fungal Specific TF [Aspergillus niger]|nr:transcriptional regulator family: Fungal Specific TF [Aspergillus niger]
MPPPEQRASTPTSSRLAAKSPRVLACVLCQQRKVRCDRKFPCASCIRAGAQCVPTLAPRPRRRRFPERELLERLRKYEDLLRQHNIPFEPLHPPAGEDSRTPEFVEHAHSEERTAGEEGQSKESVTVKAEPVYAAKDYWKVLSLVSQDAEDVDFDDDSEDGNDLSHSHFTLGGTVVNKMFDEAYKNDDECFIFGSRKANVDLSTLHPDQVQIVKLWQIYLDNVDPLLKVTHTPTLQARIIRALSDLAGISPELEALLFGVYSVAIMSLDDEECRTSFGSPRKELLQGYQFGCQQALLNCDVLRTGDRECLTALLLYLVSVRSETDPRSLSSMLGVAIRIAQRMSINDEKANARCSALEGEMRRRLWWSLIMFDNRIGEMSDHKTSMLIPTWDSSTPRNVTDNDMQPNMKDLPASHAGPTEALFIAARSELGEFLRHSAFHLDYINPSLKAVARDTKGGGMTDIERKIEDQYLRLCNPENPFHYLTIWTLRGLLAKHHLLEHYSNFSPALQSEAQRNTASSYAVRILECDTKLMSSPLTKRYRWHVHMYFPFPAHLHVIQDLKKRPMQEHAHEMWNVMSENAAIRFGDMHRFHPLSEIVARDILQAWEAYQAALGELGNKVSPPWIVQSARTKFNNPNKDTGNCSIEQPDNMEGAPSFSIPTEHDIPNLLSGLEGFGSAASGLGGYSDIFEQAVMDVDGAYQPGWPTMNFYPMW